MLCTCEIELNRVRARTVLCGPPSQPLAEARKAQELLEKGGVTGKIVLVCNGRRDG